MLGIISTHPEINRSLGVVPNDLDLSKHRCYLPVHHGWISTPGKTYWDGNLGEGSTQTQTDALTQQLIKTEKTKMWLSIMSTVASLTVAAAIFTSLRYK